MVRDDRHGYEKTEDVRPTVAEHHAKMDRAWIAGCMEAYRTFAEPSEANARDWCEATHDLEQKQIIQEMMELQATLFRYQRRAAEKTLSHDDAMVAFAGTRIAVKGFMDYILRMGGHYGT